MLAIGDTVYLELSIVCEATGLLTVHVYTSRTWTAGRRSLPSNATPPGETISHVTVAGGMLCCGGLQVKTRGELRSTTIWEDSVDVKPGLQTMARQDITYVHVHGLGARGRAGDLA